MLHLICCVREKHYEPIPRYQDQNRLFTDIALAYQQAIRSFYAACSWTTPAGVNSAMRKNGRPMRNGASTWTNWPTTMWT